MKPIAFLSRLILLGMGLPALASAESLGSIGALSQQQFIGFAENLSAATAYKSIAPAEALGSLGLDIGVELSSTEIDSTVFDQASDGSFGSSELLVPRLHAHKGLPFGLDIGASLSAVPDTDISIIGGELRYALIDGGVVTPALAVRASYSQLQGITDFDLNNSALELTVSKGFLVLTPYAGAGLVRSVADPHAIANLNKETFEQKKFYVGLAVSLGFALTLEIDRTGDYRTYSAKAGIRF
ncbi:MAG: hypothetical protein AB8B79_09635 [Granulosicoccus sp.]